MFASSRVYGIGIVVHRCVSGSWHCSKEPSTSELIGARSVTTPSVRVGMVLYAGDMPLLVVRLGGLVEPVSGLPRDCWNNVHHVPPDPDRGSGCRPRAPARALRHPGHG